MKLTPYLNFQGTCEAAIDFYQSLLGGTVVAKNYYHEAPMEISDEQKNKIMHCQLTFGDNSLMACDAFEGSSISDGNGIDLLIEFNSEKEAEAVYQKLAQEGSIVMPFEQQFWGSWLGQVVDKFGKKWAIGTVLSE